MSLDNQDFRRALGSFATGVTIVTGRSDTSEDVGVTANSFNSVSLDPPMVLWSLAKSSASMAAFLSTSHFAVHVLAAGQEDLSNRFASRGIDKFLGLEFERGVGQVPLLSEFSARFECRSVYHYEGGDHLIIVGEVVNFAHRDSQPLLFHRGRYARSATPTDPAQSSGQDIAGMVRSAYFHLLEPVRAERERRAISLVEHYMLDVWFAGPRSLEGVAATISYTGLETTFELASGLIERGLVSARATDDHHDLLGLTEAGRASVVGLRAAAHAVEAEAEIHLGGSDLEQLKALLARLTSGFTREQSVTEHMRLLAAFDTTLPTGVSHQPP